MKLLSIPGGDLDCGRLVFQVLFTAACIAATVWLLPGIEQDFRDLESGKIPSLRGNHLLGLAYKTFGATGAVIGARIVFIGGTLLSLIGIKEAIDEMKAEHAKKQRNRLQQEFLNLIRDSKNPGRRS